MPASRITSACASRTPAPQNRATFWAAFNARASRSTWDGGGTSVPCSVRKLLVPVGPAAGSAATSPGKTSTETPRAPSACCTATRSSRGSWAGWPTISQKLLQSVNTRSGWVSWKNPVPICPDGMCEASASTGSPLRCAS